MIDWNILPCLHWNFFLCSVKFPFLTSKVYKMKCVRLCWGGAVDTQRVPTVNGSFICHACKPAFGPTTGFESLDYGRPASMSSRYTVAEGVCNACLFIGLKAGNQLLMLLPICPSNASAS